MATISVGGSISSGLLEQGVGYAGKEKEPKSGIIGELRAFLSEQRTFELTISLV